MVVAVAVADSTGVGKSVADEETVGDRPPVPTPMDAEAHADVTEEEEEILPEVAIGATDFQLPQSPAIGRSSDRDVEREKVMQ